MNSVGDILLSAQMYTMEKIDVFIYCIGLMFCLFLDQTTFINITNRELHTLSLGYFIKYDFLNINFF